MASWVERDEKGEDRGEERRGEERRERRGEERRGEEIKHHPGPKPPQPDHHKEWLWVPVPKWTSASHLLYMDDIKLYAKSVCDIDSLIHLTRIYSKDIQRIITDVQNNYKYLGIPQANGNHEEAARRSATVKYLQRLRQVLKKLNGTVLVPFLFTLYTVDFSYSSSSCHLQKFADDPAAVGLITDGDDTEYRGLIQDFVDWNLRNQSRSTPVKPRIWWWISAGVTTPPPMDIDIVKTYKYLDVHLNNNLDWTHALVKKGNSRLFLLRRLRSFRVQVPLLRTFYDSVVGSAIFYEIVCWSSSITDRDRRRMDRLVRRVSSVLGCPLDSVEVLGNGRMMAKL
ncbi:hypothetical protein D4764_16G0001340 [Takifugu flavidus]|uniref:Alkylated DNA repair protein AlkB homologue 8 N-terminal domain-containing protein n=1 Tax=Takifugu flavidus TaxID=433684 RepID=A0A5C6P0P1_9TELE|nr:hypothetical protein D4764_16G0001340 [Takifugu flavidus]